MKTKTYNLLNFCFFLLCSVVATAQTELALPKKNNVLILEKSSRVELRSQKINLEFSVNISAEGRSNF